MKRIYLFDWGDTLMVDFPNQKGKMCDWERVEAMPGAHATLACLAKEHGIYIATNAQDSGEHDIREAFERVDLARHISGYFCLANLGIAKGTADFYLAIAKRLAVGPESLTMVGDSLEKDILPALEAGLNAVWLSSTPVMEQERPYRQIRKLNELCSR